jgi:23S rRNA pseudouridine2605 synthase
LILVTNDGELANKLTHPKYGIHKKYHVKVDGVPTTQQLRSLEEGVYIAEGKAKAESAKRLRGTESHSWLEIVLSEGKNREIRRILAKLGHKVRVLKRVGIGPLKLADLPLGAHRRLTTQEIKMLKRAADGLAPLKHKERRTSKRKPGTPTASGDAPRKPVQPFHQGASKKPKRSPIGKRRPHEAGAEGSRTNRNKKSGPKQFSQIAKPDSSSRTTKKTTGKFGRAPLPSSSGPAKSNRRPSKKSRGR